MSQKEIATAATNTTPPAVKQNSRLKIFFRYLVLTFGIMTVTTISGGQMGLLSGKRPSGLGVQNGQLKPAPASPNCVSSQASTAYHQIAPFPVQGDPQAAFERLKGIVAGMSAAKVIESKPDYVYAEFTTKLMGFVDDVEFHLDDKAAVIHVRSASRLGLKDFGVNRARVEAIRTAYVAGR